MKIERRMTQDLEIRIAISKLHMKGAVASAEKGFAEACCHTETPSRPRTRLSLEVPRFSSLVSSFFFEASSETCSGTVKLATESHLKAISEIEESISYFCFQ